MPSLYAAAAIRIRSVLALPQVGFATLLPATSIERVLDVDEPEEPLCVAVLGVVVNVSAASAPVSLAVEVSPEDEEVVAVVVGGVASVVEELCIDVVVEELAWAHCPWVGVVCTELS